LFLESGVLLFKTVDLGAHVNHPLLYYVVEGKRIGGEGEDNEGKEYKRRVSLHGDVLLVINTITWCAILSIKRWS
jgi:hypothetical protein